jgi:hypothetical protein
MRKVIALSTLAVALVLPLLYAGAASAQATRTWVSGVGDDVNPCSRTAPCKTWAGAISKTADGGEISALDPGGYGAVTITKGITLNGDGTLASTLASGTNGIIVNIINPAAKKDVVIRSLSINGAGTTLGVNGIRVLAANSVSVVNTTIENFSASCIEVNVTAGGVLVNVNDVNMTNCTTGISVSNTAASQRSSVNVTRTKITDVGTGINGVRQANITVKDSYIAGAGTVGVVVNTIGAPASEANIDDSLITMSALGLQINAGATGRINRVFFAANLKALDNNGTCQSATNNSNAGNVNGNTGGACTPLPQF